VVGKGNPAGIAMEFSDGGESIDVGDLCHHQDGQELAKTRDGADQPRPLVALIDFFD